MIKLAVNGVQRQFDGDPTTPLLWFVRDELNLPGTRFGCGMGLCGCCTVHIGDKAARSCITPMQDVNGASITTIEGLPAKAPAAAGGLHPVQAVWLEENVPQCGYCQSGQIMQAAALLTENPRPSDDDISAAMAGNLCRCGTYPRIHRAIKICAYGRPKSVAALADGMKTEEQA
jgi:isoquinoline 1-oxidoreductase alpha subunit